MYQTIRSGFNSLVSTQSVMHIVLLLFHLLYLILPLSQDLPRHALVCSHSLVQSLTLGKIKMEGVLLNNEAYNLNNEHPSSFLMLSTTALSSITLLLPRYLDLYH